MGAVEECIFSLEGTLSPLSTSIRMATSEMESLKFKLDDLEIGLSDFTSGTTCVLLTFLKKPKVPYLSKSLPRGSKTPWVIMLCPQPLQ